MKSIVAVTTAASSYNLTTRAKVVAELRLSNPSGADLALIDQQITDASAAIAGYCNRTLLSESVTETFWPDPTALNFRGGGSWEGAFWSRGAAGVSEERLRLDRWPVTAVTSVTMDGDLVASTLYRRDDEAGLLFALDDSGYPDLWRFGKSIIVAYAGGYTTVPADLDRAARLWVVDSWFAAAQDPRLKSRDVYGVVSKTWDVGGTSRRQFDLPGDVETLVYRYRRHPVA
jgi:hypothetical protein